jgi:hypothetical protein
LHAFDEDVKEEKEKRVDITNDVKDNLIVRLDFAFVE